ncbi:MAG: RagB/SusD family nutrient uptake outer membrane protein [Prevotellaceae bacterium]|jgi:hypothetical protein|nr:RagB/SusD family nutrient uptake outer membrane protein [Prevotellaceae bacterium]
MKKIISFSILCVFALTSCSDFLDVKPSNQADSSVSILTADDALVMINGLMRRMTSYDYYGRNFILYGDAKGGDLALVSQGRGLDALYTFNHSASSNSYSGYWSHIYNSILQANNLIINIDKLIDGGNTSAKLQQYKAEALTARAIFYYDLVRLYGKPYDMDKTSYGVPLPLEPLDASVLPVRESVESVYTQILKDLTDAAQSQALLQPSSSTRGYISYYANIAMQARVYLQMQNYTAALSAAEEIINSEKYTLYTNAEWVNSWKSQFGNESIFELYIVPDESDLATGSLGFYLRRLGHGSNSAMGWFVASDAFVARLGEDTDDVRLGIMDNDELAGNSKYPSGRLGSCYKYSGSTSLQGDGKATATAVNIKVIRLSEIYLIAAEAALLKSPSDKEKAAKYLQEIRKRAPNLTPADENNITLDMIINEKSKELFAEGHRFFDMMRWNKEITFNDELLESSTITHREKTIDRTFYKTILPISLGELNANPAIREQQNPGY